MKRMLITTIVFAGVTIAMLLAMSVRSFAGVTPALCTTACIGPQGQVKVGEDPNCCETDDDCSGADSNGWVCRTLPGGGGGGDDDDDDVVSVQSCPSLIGGRGIGGNITNMGGTPTPVIRYSAYFFATPNSNYVTHAEAAQSVETAASIRGLDVRLLPALASNSNYTFEIQGGVASGGGRPACTITGNGAVPNCVSTSAQCIDVNPGDLISVKATPSGTVSPSNNTPYHHSAVLDGCVCCDGNPPDLNGNCYEDD